MTRAALRLLALPAALSLGAGLLSGGCAGARRGGRGGHAPWIGAGGPVAETRDELLVATGDAVWRGDLATAHAALTRLADRERGVPDTALDFWSELLALLRCEPLPKAPRAERGDHPLADPWDGLRRLVQIERVRLGRVVRASAESEVVGPGERDRAGEVVWPVEHEHWSDELPTPAIVSRCAPTGEAAARHENPRAAGAPEVALVAGAAQALPPSHPARALLLLQAGVLEVARGRAVAARAALAALGDDAGVSLTSGEKQAAVLAAAIAAIDDPSSSPEQVLFTGRGALALELAAPTRRALALLLAERLVGAKRFDDATAVLGAPPHGDDELGRYIAFRQAEAHGRAGRRAELLGEAREALHRASRAEVEEDPALTGTMDVALRTLLASPVSAETMEVLESLGPPRERLGRAEAFAQMALENGSAQAAMATFLWLHDNDTDAGRQLQHLARASVAAARAGDRAEFARTFRTLAGQAIEDDDADGDARPAGAKRDARGRDGKGAAQSRAPGTDAKTARESREATQRREGRDGALIASGESDRARKKRRASRSANWQRALLVVARDALSALVENDDQTNLATLVETLKRHLGAGGRGPVDEELTTLYRAASAHLKVGARAYAETVGTSRRPIILGDVLVGRSYDVQPPSVDLGTVAGEAGPLVFVPARGNDPSLSSLRRWPAPFGVAWTGSRS